MSKSKQQSDYRNTYLTFAGNLTISHEDGITTYAIRNPVLWLNNKSAKYNDFEVHAEDFESAKQLFWMRYSSYCKRRFNCIVPFVDNRNKN